MCFLNLKNISPNTSSKTLCLSSKKAGSIVLSSSKVVFFRLIHLELSFMAPLPSPCTIVASIKLDNSCELMSFIISRTVSIHDDFPSPRSPQNASILGTSSLGDATILSNCSSARVYCSLNIDWA